ncbi:hypothetical protein MCAP1_001252 [Malassezia caprae]|uniref:Mediator of RNA polymerase II transcription subunit 21 n=1 Tax=Malassezia caprae TaxID=1381934 RepID=A0AAF0EAF8_9BASI|nr:hypothetical protein MCAP1_001252 [Malassezia caprae]
MLALTELEDSLDTLLKVMASAIAYTSRKSSHKQVHPQVPLTTLGNTEGLAPDVMAASQDELVSDLITQAKDVQRRISELPAMDQSDEAQMAALADLERDLHEANQEYKQALSEADLLSHQLNNSLARLCTERQAARVVLDAPDTSLSRESVEARNS